MPMLQVVPEISSLGVPGIKLRASDLAGAPLPSEPFFWLSVSTVFSQVIYL